MMTDQQCLHVSPTRNSKPLLRKGVWMNPLSMAMDPRKGVNWGLRAVCKTVAESVGALKAVLDVCDTRHQILQKDFDDLHVYHLGDLALMPDDIVLCAINMEETMVCTVKELYERADGVEWDGVPRLAGDGHVTVDLISPRITVLNSGRKDGQYDHCNLADVVLEPLTRENYRQSDILLKLERIADRRVFNLIVKNDGFGPYGNFKEYRVFTEWCAQAEDEWERFGGPVLEDQDNEWGDRLYDYQALVVQDDRKADVNGAQAPIYDVVKSIYESTTDDSIVTLKRKGKNVMDILGHGVLESLKGSGKLDGIYLDTEQKIRCQMPSRLCKLGGSPFDSAAIYVPIK